MIVYASSYPTVSANILIACTVRRTAYAAMADASVTVRHATAGAVGYMLRCPVQGVVGLKLYAAQDGARKLPIS